MYFYTWTRSVKLRIDVSHTVVTFPLVKELKYILIGPFEFVYYLHAIHSVKLPKIVGVKSCNLVLAPNQKLLPTPLMFKNIHKLLNPGLE